jgi:hypothetical protein
VCQPFFTAQNGNDIDDIQLGSYKSAVNFEIAGEQLNDLGHPLSTGTPYVLGAVQAMSGAARVTIDGQPAGNGQMLLPKNVTRTDVFVGYALYGTCPSLTSSVGEVLIYNRGLSDPELDSVHAYLKARWACCGG